MQGLEAVASHLMLRRVWDFWKGVAELSMAQSSQHELLSFYISQQSIACG
jgi:hypothetical protein